MRQRKLALSLTAVAVLLAASAEAHFTLVLPRSAWATDDGGKGPPPCGAGLPSDVVTKVVGGEPLMIRLSEFVPHPGHYRIALSINSRAELPPDPEVEADGFGISISAAIQNPPQFPVLADGLFAHTDASVGRTWETEIVLPNVSCERCTLQIVEFMAQHGFNVGGGYFYHHCADLQITPKAKPEPRGRRRIVASAAPSVVFISWSYVLTNNGDVPVAVITIAEDPEQIP